MLPAQIKFALALRGSTQSQVANDCDVGRSVVHDVIEGRKRSRKIEMQIAAKTGLPLGDLWPQWHGTKAQRSRRAPMSPTQVADAIRSVAR